MGQFWEKAWLVLDKKKWEQFWARAKMLVGAIGSAKSGGLRSHDKFRKTGVSDFNKIML